MRIHTYNTWIDLWWPDWPVYFYYPLWHTTRGGSTAILYIHVCKYICIHISMRIYIYMCVYIYIYIYIYTYSSLFLLSVVTYNSGGFNRKPIVYVYSYTFIGNFMHIFHIINNKYIYIYINIYIYIRMHMNTYIRIYVYMYMYLWKTNPAYLDPYYG
jgi:hypothetical protein